MQKWATERGRDGLLHVVDETGVRIFTSAPPPPGVSDAVPHARALLAAAAPAMRDIIDELRAELEALKAAAEPTEADVEETDVEATTDTEESPGDAPPKKRRAKSAKTSEV